MADGDNSDASRADPANMGKVIWRDLTVPDAEQVASFYERVVGWKPKPHDMGDYNDYVMVNPPEGEGVAGVCHARGTNASVPPQWLLYVQVPSVETAAKAACEAGGEVVDGPRPMGAQQFCVIRDPAGAVLALMSD